MVQYRLNIETESRIRWKVYVRFGGEHLEIAHVHMIRRRVLSLHIPGKSYKVIGFTESETQRWTPDYDGCFVVDGANMSNNGKYVVGACRIWRATDETTDYYIPYLYDVENDKFTAYEDEST